LGWGVVVAGVVLPLARRRLRMPGALAAGASAAAPLGMVVATRRSVKRDVAVYALQMWAFIVIHELPTDDAERLESRTRIDYPIDFDRRLFGRSINVVLQETFSRPDRVTLLDKGLTWVHWLWFAQPHAAAAWILWRHRERFGRSALMICSVFDLGVIVYFFAPTAPPWWAAERSRLPAVRRIMVEVGEVFWGGSWDVMYGFLGSNPVAAMPSLHFASSVMAAHVLADIDPVAGAAGWAYAVTLGVALVYLGEHYIVDLAAGAALTEAIRFVGPGLAPGIEKAVELVGQLEARAHV
jgi:membrane-associated phospholipid phosphatase